MFYSGSTAAGIFHFQNQTKNRIFAQRQNKAHE